jgi:hypothetical protein
LKALMAVKAMEWIIAPLGEIECVKRVWSGTKRLVVVLNITKSQVYIYLETINRLFKVVDGRH